MWETFTLWPGATIRTYIALLAVVVAVVVIVVARRIWLR